jgi:RNA recognition motif-containing protein
MEGKHLRVDLDFKEEGSKGSNDFETTVFIGNLPFIVNEEDVRNHIATAFAGKPDPIKNVRLIRDP